MRRYHTSLCHKKQQPFLIQASSGLKSHGSSILQSGQNARKNSYLTLLSGTHHMPDSQQPWRCPVSEAPVAVNMQLIRRVLNFDFRTAHSPGSTFPGIELYYKSIPRRDRQLLMPTWGTGHMLDLPWHSLAKCRRTSTARFWRTSTMDFLSTKTYTHEKTSVLTAVLNVCGWRGGGGGV